MSDEIEEVILDDFESEPEDEDNEEEIEENENITHHDDNEKNTNKAITITYAAKENNKILSLFEKTVLIQRRFKDISNGGIAYIPDEIIKKCKLTSSQDIATFEVEYAIQQIIDSRSKDKFLPPYGEDPVNKIIYTDSIDRQYGNIIDTLNLTDFKYFPDQGYFKKIYKKYLKKNN